MQIIYYIIFLLILNPILSVLLVTCSSYKYYPIAYKFIKDNKDKCIYIRDVIHIPNSPIYIFEDGTVELTYNRNYLFNMYLNYLSPYNLYWHLKYKKLIKEIRKSLESNL